MICCNNKNRKIFSNNIDTVSEKEYNADADMASEYSKGEQEHEKKYRIAVSIIPDSGDRYRSHERREAYMDTGGARRHHRP